MRRKLRQHFLNDSLGLIVYDADVVVGSRILEDVECVQPGYYVVGAELKTVRENREGLMRGVVAAMSVARSISVARNEATS